MALPTLRSLLLVPLALALPAMSGAAQDPDYTPADVAFMQGMIAHHAQAVIMADLVPTHTTLESLHLLAERIRISQTDEIKLMQHWLEDRHQRAPDPLGPHGDHRDMPMMPGMLTPAQMDGLRAARGPAFDRLFLEGMIQHHQGALTMVKNLYATPGAGQETALFKFAADVDADQRAEIARMQALLDRLPPASGR